MLLKNKLGLDNDIELAKEEERITKLKAIEYSYPFREKWTKHENLVRYDFKKRAW